MCGLTGFVDRRNTLSAEALESIAAGMAGTLPRAALRVP